MIDKAFFEDLIQSLKEAVVIRRGESVPGRVAEVHDQGIELDAATQRATSLFVQRIASPAIPGVLIYKEFFV